MFGCNGSELGCAVQVESRVANLQVVNQSQTRFTFAQASAHRYTGRDSLVRTCITDAVLSQIGQEPRIVIAARGAGSRVCRRGEANQQQGCAYHREPG